MGTQTQRNQYQILGVVILLTMLLSFIFPTSTVFADDTTPPEDTQEEVVSNEADGEEIDIDVSSEGEDVDNSSPDEEDDGIENTDEEAGDEDSLIAQLPNGTDVVVLDEEGQVVSLASQEAADAIIISDPLWCPDGVDPIAHTGGCTDSYPSLTALLASLTGGNQPNQDGTIWIEKTYNSSTAEPGGTTNITIDGSSRQTWRNNSLTIQGGWDGPGTKSVSGTSLFSGDRFRIINWRDDVTVRNIVIDGASGAPSLEIEIDTTSTNTYNVLLENVEVKNNTNNRGAQIDNDESTGSVTINNSKFINNGNNDDGLYIDARGSVTLLNVTAYENGDEGVEIDNRDSTNRAPVQLLGTNVFTNIATGTGNNGYGLYIRSDGAITLNNITADDSTSSGGAYIDNDESGANSSSTVTITGTNSFSDNGNGDGDYGLQIISRGQVTLENIIANDNPETGVYIDNRPSNSNAAVTMNGVNNISNNADDGLIIYSDGTITLNEITANGNGIGSADNGAQLDNDSGNSDVIITGFHNSFSNNAGPGLDIVTDGNIEVFFATISGNNTASGSQDGAVFNSSNTTSTATKVYCSIFENNKGYGLNAFNFRGSLNFMGDNSFNNNPSGDYRYNGTAAFEDYDCIIPNSQANGGGGKGGNKTVEVIIPLTGNQFITLSCENPMTKLQMLNGNYVILAELCGYDALLDEVPEVDLPGGLPDGGQYVSGLNVVLTQDGDEVEPLPDGTNLMVAFKVPSGMASESFAILHWDRSSWVEESVIIEDGYVKTTSSNTGTYVLVVK